MAFIIGFLLLLLLLLLLFIYLFLFIVFNTFLCFSHLKHKFNITILYAQPNIFIQRFALYKCNLLLLLLLLLLSLSKEAQRSTNSLYSFLPPSIIFGPYSFPKPPFLVYEVFIEIQGLVRNQQGGGGVGILNLGSEMR